MSGMLPPTDSMLYDGWLLRFTPGVSRNPNSVWPLYPGSDPIEDRVRFCEQQYADRGLACSFRLTEGDDQDAIADILSQRGYVVHNPNQVLTRTISESDGDIDSVNMNTWLEILHRIDPEMTDEAIEMKRGPLSRITLPAWYGLLSHEDEPSTYGRAVREGNLFQLAELWTSPTLRNRGLGTRLIHGLLRIGLEAGATTAFMPVSVTNEGAWRLYSRLGFEEAYAFRYMIRPA